MREQQRCKTSPRELRAERRQVRSDPTLLAYEIFAPIYNEFNYLNNYEVWVGQVLLPELTRHGLRPGRVLDVGCGTGRAFAPLLDRGWRIYGCDLSPSMLKLATQEGRGQVELSVADMRELPVFGEFELVMALNDPVNYLLTDSELEAALAGMRANMAEDGLLVFDCNSKATFGTLFSGGKWHVERGGRRWTWRGLGEVHSMPKVFDAVIEGDDIDPIGHRERYRAIPEICECLSGAGFCCHAVLGLSEVEHRPFLCPNPDESSHYKVMYIAGCET